MFTLRKRSFSRKHICITGGSDGFGFAIAELFVKEGADISLIARTESKLQKARRTLVQVAEEKDLPSKIVAVSGDCSQFASIQSAIKTAVDSLGPVDVLIASAGGAAPGNFIDVEASAFESQMQINYLGTVYSVKCVIDGMISRRSGDIVIISSALGVLGMTGIGYSAYAPTKWAVRGFADCLRMEMQAYNVHVRIAYPPNMNTTGYKQELKHTPDAVKDMMIASGDTVFEPEVVAKAILKGKYSRDPFLK